MDAKQWALIPPLLRLLGPCVFYNLRTIQSSHELFKHNSHDTISLIARMSQTNHGQTAKRRDNPSPPYHTFLVF